MTVSLVARDVVHSHGADRVLDGVSLSLGPGDRVAVVGPNGIGKSTFLRVLAGLVPADSGSVIRSPRTTVCYIPQEIEPLPGATLREHLLHAIGVTGAAARLETLAATLGEHPERADAYEEALARFVALGGEDADARVMRACAQLGLVDHLERPLAAVSGGQAARLRLAQTLAGRFDVLLLDEPTNDLDFAGLALLEQSLVEREEAVVVVSHDRAFLQQVATRVLSFEPETRRPIELHGTFAEFERERDALHAREAEAYRRWAAERSHFEALRATRAVQARAAGKQASRRGTQAAASKVRAAKRRVADLDRNHVEKPWRAWELSFELSAGAVQRRLAVRLTGAVIEQGGFRLGPLDLTIGGRDRIALVGANGSGKSTLMRALLGELALTTGERWIGPAVEVGTLDQGRTLCATDEPLLDAFRAAAELEETDARTLLGHFNLLGDAVLRRARSLSPGERTRVTMALLQARRPSLLLLDEPTNHLDLEGIEQLELALDAYPGAVVLITHDRRLLERFRADRRLELRDGTLHQR